MIQRGSFPRLTDTNHRVTSPSTISYNCVAWPVGDARRWWQPGACWPIPATADDVSIEALLRAFAALGYQPCESTELEPGIEKVALYGSGMYYTHAARQLPDGRWTSKLGKAEDIEHQTPDDLAGGLYGDIVRIMQRPVPSRTSELPDQTS